MPKVAINRDYGGFDLSDEAFEALLDRKGIAWEKSLYRFGMCNYYKKGHLGDDEQYISNYEMYENRADPDLIAVIEEFGDKANGRYACIAIVDVPDDVKWDLVERDGMEWVAEKHRIWS